MEHYRAAERKSIKYVAAEEAKQSCKKNIKMLLYLNLEMGSKSAWALALFNWLCITLVLRFFF